MSCVRTRVLVSGNLAAREQGHLIGRASSRLGVVLPCRQLGLTMNSAYGLEVCEKNSQVGLVQVLLILASQMLLSVMLALGDW